MARTAAATLAPASTYSELDLSGEFTLSSPSRKTRARITLPGDVHTALLEAGEIPDPYFGANEQAVMWVHATPWIMERRFTASRDERPPAARYVEHAADRGRPGGSRRDRGDPLGHAHRLSSPSHCRCGAG